MHPGKVTICMLSTLLISFPLVAQRTRIMPLGDSITKGIGSTGDNLGYRKPLWKMLTPTYKVNFVGSLRDGDGTFDENHEGHPGWKASEIRQNIGNWLQQNTPDFVLFHIGTNDISAGRPTQDILNDIDATLAAIWNRNANAHVFLCSLIPRKDNKNDATKALNTSIKNLVSARKSQHSIHFVDQYKAFVSINDWQNSLMWNYLHPNNSGYQLMAETFYNILVQYLSPATPVELVNFSATLSHGEVLLQWRTASETNNLGFYIEHSFETGPFEEIGFVTGNGTSTQPHSYAYLHRVAESGRHHYRLRQVDTDGGFEFSKTIEVIVAPPTSLVLYPSYPNPFVPGASRSGFTQIEFEIPKAQPVQVQIFDIQGRLIKSLYEGQKRAGRYTIPWDGQTKNGTLAPSGTYFIRVKTPTRAAVQRLQLVR